MPAPTRLLPEEYTQIDNEHEQLKKFISDLHDTCCNLDNELAVNHALERK